MRAPPSVAVIGLDCAEPSLVFDRWLDQLPNLGRLVVGGTWGRLRSVDPPITVPAWSCMMSSRDPGELGVYGFRNRRDHAYQNLRVADSRAIALDRVWDHLLTPDPRRDQYTHPPQLRARRRRRLVAHPGVAEGGYYCGLCLNVQGREPCGIVDPDD